MKAFGERSIASFIRLVLDASWWLAAVALASLIGLLAYSLCVNLEGNSNNLTMNLPVALELDAPVRDSGASTPTDAQLEKLRGNLRFPVRSAGHLEFAGRRSKKRSRRRHEGKAR